MNEIRHDVVSLLKAGIVKEAADVLAGLPLARWERITAYARAQGLSGLLHLYCSRDPRCAALIPAQTAQRFRLDSLAIARQNLFIERTLERINQSFSRAGIDFILVKGLHLAHTLYADSASRSMTDIDLLVKPGDFPAAASCLGRLGYEPWQRLDCSRVPVENAYRNSMIFCTVQGSPRSVHLYWHLLNLCLPEPGLVRSFSMQRLWQESVIEPVAGMPMRCLCPEHDLIYLCLHAFTHSNRPLVRLADIWQLMRCVRLDWRKIVSDAAMFGLSRYLYLQLAVTDGVFKSSVPPAVLRSLRPRQTSAGERLFIRDCIAGVSSDRHVAAACLGMAAGVGGKLGYCRRMLAPSRQDMAALLHCRQSAISWRDYLRRWGLAIAPNNQLSR